MKLCLLNQYFQTYGCRALVFGTGGYLSGSALEVFVGDMKRYELLMFPGILLAGLAVWTVHFYRKYRRKPE